MNHRPANHRSRNRRSTSHRAARPSAAVGRPVGTGRRRLTLTLLVSGLALAFIVVAPQPFAPTATTETEEAASRMSWWNAWLAEAGSSWSAATPSERKAAREARRAAHAAGQAPQEQAQVQADAEPAEVPQAAAEAVPNAQGAPEAAGEPTTSTATGTTATSAPRATSGGSSQGILLSQAELMKLPTSGPAWDAIMARIASPYGGSYTLGTRDESNKDVLANALAGARLGNATYKDFARDKIEHMMSAARNTGDVLGTLRHLQTYVISADLIDLASFDPALDGRFRTWLASEIRSNYVGGGGGGSVISTHDKKPNNFGTHAGATRIAAALYLGDKAELQAARDVWYGWATGDPSYAPSTRVWTGTSWQCGDGGSYGINPQGCSRDGLSLDGVIPEDQERCGEFSSNPCATNYIHGATDGMALSFWMLARQGENPWAWGDQAALRQMEWKYEMGQEPYSGFRWQIPVIEDAYGMDFAGNDPTATSTNFGFADWWTQ